MSIESLKQEAKELGIKLDDSKEYKASALKSMITRAKNEIADSNSSEELKEQETKGVKLTPLQVKKLKAISLRKVSIYPLDPNDKGEATTINIENSEFGLKPRVIPYRTPIALEQAYINELQSRTYLGQTDLTKFNVDDFDQEKVKEAVKLFPSFEIRYFD